MNTPLTLSLRKESVVRASSASASQASSQAARQGLVNARQGRDQIGPTLTTSFTTIG